MVFGGMDEKVVIALKTMKVVKGSTWDANLLENASSSLAHELALKSGTPGGMEIYRQTIALSIFCKFYHHVRRNFIHEDPSVPIPSSQNTAIEDYEEPSKRRPFESIQVCQKVSKDQESIDPVGRAIPHVSSKKHITGEAEFVDDIPELRNELSAAFVTSTVARATIIDVDPSEALKIKGIIAFYSAKDIPADRNLVRSDEEMFASKRVSCIGQIIGIILGQNPDVAHRAAKCVAVKYGNEEKPILTIEEAIEENSLWDPISIVKGNAELSLKSCDRVLEGNIRIGGQEHFYMEPNAHLAVPRDQDELVIYSTSQDPLSLQSTICHIINLPKNRVVFKAKRVGGAFGGKQARATAIAAPVAFAAHKIQQPVRVVLDRQEDMLMTGGRHPMLAKWKVGFQDDGKIEAVDVKLFANAGWCLELSDAVVTKSLYMLHGPYNIPNRHFVGHSCKTNLPSNTAFRGFGIPQSTLIMEDVITRVAEYLKLDSKQVKERNITPPDVPQNNTDEDSSIINRCWEEVLQVSKYDDRLQEINMANSSNKMIKRGISAIPISYGIGYFVTWMQQAGAMVLVYSDGSVLLSHGGIEMGQGVQTKMIQVASKALQIPCDKIYTAEFATNSVPNASVSAASISSDINGMAVLV